MGKILLIATNPQMKYLADEYKRINKLGDHLIIDEGAMDEAVKVANTYIDKDVDVVICRGGSGKSLLRAKFPLPVVDMPIRDEEVMQSIEDAIKISGIDNPRIAFLGYSSTYNQIKAFIEALDIEIDHYDVTWGKEYAPLIERIHSNYDVILGGNKAQFYATKYKTPSVIMAASSTSIDMAYSLALGVQTAILKERQWSRDLNAIINSMQEGLLSVNENMEILLFNEKARNMFSLDHSSPTKTLKDLIPKIDYEYLESIFQSKVGASWILDVHGLNYAVEVFNLTDEGSNKKMLLLFREVQQLQKIETRARKEIYVKGHVAEYCFRDILGSSSSINKAIKNAQNFSHTDSHIYLYGETGTGKELFAQSIHCESRRRTGPFVAINCGAIPSSILESELFGYEDGAFTGAKKGGKMGIFEMSHGGTLFLDEISELNASGQVSLLRVLQENKIRRIGGEGVLPIDIRLITASNRPLAELVRQGKFREDLYYRLCVLTLNVPSLRDRPDDIAILANQFILHFNQKFNRNISLAKEAYQTLREYPWPGNIRQLKNFCERIVAISSKQKVTKTIIIEEMNEAFASLYSSSLFSSCSSLENESIIVKNQVITIDELNRLLEKHKGNRLEIANELGISRTTLWKLLKKYVYSDERI